MTSEVKWWVYIPREPVGACRGMLQQKHVFSACTLCHDFLKICDPPSWKNLSAISCLTYHTVVFCPKCNVHLNLRADLTAPQANIFFHLLWTEPLERDGLRLSMKCNRAVAGQQLVMVFFVPPKVCEWVKQKNSGLVIKFQLTLKQSIFKSICDETKWAWREIVGIGVRTQPFRTH